MKTILAYIIGIGAILGLIFMGTGCAALDERFAKVETVRTLMDGTNAVPITITELSPSPTMKATTELIKAVPLPYAGSAGIAIGWLFSAYAAARNKRALVAVVKGIEAAREWLQTTPEGQKTDAILRKQLIIHQDAFDVLNVVGKVVNEHTGQTVKAGGAS